MDVNTPRESAYVDDRHPFLAPTPRAAAVQTNLEIVRVSDEQEEYAHDEIAPSRARLHGGVVLEQAADAGTRFHCVFALPVVKQLANVCAASCSQSCDVSNVDAVMRYPNPLMAFARTLSPRSDTHKSAPCRDTVSVRSNHLFLRC